MIFTDYVPLYCNKRCRVESEEEFFLSVSFFLSLKVLLNPGRDEEWSVRAEGESGRIKEPELPFSKPLIPVGFCEFVPWCTSPDHFQPFFSCSSLEKKAPFVIH